MFSRARFFLAAMVLLAVASSLVSAPAQASPTGFSAKARGQFLSVAADPGTNITPSPAYAASGCESAPTSTTCQNNAIAALNHARAVMGIAPYSLPSNFQSLAAASQFLWLSNQDRAAYGLPQILGFNAALNAAAAAGVATDSDPQGPPTVDGARFTAWTANWAAGWASPLYTYYEWMYDDGYPGSNADCPTSTSPGCWGHRRSTLHDFGASKVYMGVGAGTSPTYHAAAFTELYMGFAPTASISSITALPLVGAKPGSIRQVAGSGRGDIIGRLPDGTLSLYQNGLPTNANGFPYSSGRQVGTGWQSFTNISVADVNCDGYSDITATTPSGYLMYYPDGIATNPGAVPYTSGSVIGTGFSIFTKVVLADVNGDGCADLLGLKPDGTLWLYLNGLASNSAGPPFGGGTQIGGGWNMFTQLTVGDVNGDGRADIVGVTASGSLYLYLNSFASNLSSTPYPVSMIIGGGWQTLSHVGLCDVSGDGYADVVAVLPNGALLYYPNNINSSPAHMPYSSGTVIGSGWTIFDTLA